MTVPSRSSLQAIIERCGLRLTAEQYDRLWIYHGMLRAANPELNLTRIHNFENIRTLHESLRDLGMQHVGWGARPEDYRFVREALITAIRKSSAQWNDELARDWRRAITAIVVPMLEGAAVHTAVIAEQMAEVMP